MCSPPSIAKKQALDASDVFSRDTDLLELMSMICHGIMTSKDVEYEYISVLTVINRPWEVSIGGVSLEPMAYGSIHRIQRSELLRLTSVYLDQDRMAQIKRSSYLPVLLLRVASTVDSSGKLISMRVLETAHFHLWASLESSNESTTSRHAVRSVSIGSNNPLINEDGSKMNFIQQIAYTNVKAIRDLHQLCIDASESSSDLFIAGKKLLMFQYNTSIHRATSYMFRDSTDSIGSALYRLADPTLVRGDIIKVLLKA